MSDWGLVAFCYDYEREDKWEGTKYIKGVISKAYKSPSVATSMLQARR